MNSEKQPTHAVVLMRHDGESDSDRFSLLEALPSLKSAISYGDKYNKELICGDIVVAAPIEHSTEAIKNAVGVWYVVNDGYAVKLPIYKTISYLYSLRGFSGGSIIVTAIDAGVDNKLIVTCLHDCASQILSKLSYVDSLAETKLKQIKRYIDGKISRRDLACIQAIECSDFSSAVSSIIDNPSSAASMLSVMRSVDAVGIIKSYITERVVFSAAVNKHRKKAMKNEKQ